MLQRCKHYDIIISDEGSFGRKVKSYIVFDIKQLKQIKQFITRKRYNKSYGIVTLELANIKNLSRTRPRKKMWEEFI